MSYKFFQNKKCEFYPCHKGLKEINCLHCYCPIYHVCLERTENKWKCEECTFFYKKGNFKNIMKVIKNEYK